MLLCLRMRSTFVCVFDAENKRICFILYVCGCLKFKCLRSCWLNIRSTNVAKAALLCKNYTSIIKLTNLSLVFFPSLKSPISPLSPPCPPLSTSVSLLDLYLMSYINTIPMEEVRHGTDMVQTSVFEGVCVRMHTRTQSQRSPSPFPAWESSAGRDRVMEGGGWAKSEMER